MSKMPRLSSSRTRIMPPPPTKYKRKEYSVRRRGSATMTLPVNVVTPLLITRLLDPLSKNPGVSATSPSTPKISPSQAACPPIVKCAFPAAFSRSTKLLFPAKVAPKNPRICRSPACADAGIHTTLATTATHNSLRMRLAHEQTQEYPRERRHVQIPGREIQTLRQPRAVRKQEQRRRSARRHDHQRRGHAALAELPHNRLAVVALHEPADAVRQRHAVDDRRRPCRGDRVGAHDDAGHQGEIEFLEVARRGDHSAGRRQRARGVARRRRVAAAVD